jgi:hypothetical protein
MTGNQPTHRDLGTGEIGRLCGVCRRTVADWIDGGMMKGYRIPGKRRDRMAKAADVLAFIIEHEMPVPPELAAYVKAPPSE